MPHHLRNVVVLIASCGALGMTLAAAQDRAAGLAQAEAQDRPGIVGGKPVAEVRGIWRSRGYGYLAQLDASGVKLFHVAAGFCYADPGASDDVDGMFSFYRPFAPDALAFSTDVGGTRVVFDRLPRMPEACADRTPWTPPRIVALIAATFADLYPTFERRRIDWTARTAAAAQAVNDKTDGPTLFKVLEEMLKGINDPHVELQAKTKKQELQFMPGEGSTLSRMREAFGSSVMDDHDYAPGYREGISSTVLKGTGTVKGNQRLYWGLVGEIGYLNILSMEGLSARGESGDKAVIEAAMNEANAAFAGASAVIVDVSYNLGGFDGVSRQIAGRFTDHRRLAYTKLAVGAHDVEPQAFHVEPSERKRYLGPIYLITSNVTVSAGEIFTLLMRALPQVLHVGETTRGALSDMTEKPLPNGWSLSLPAEIYRDPDGQWYEAAGIPPQMKAEVFPTDDLSSGHAHRVMDLMALIRDKLPAP